MFRDPLFFLILFSGFCFAFLFGFQDHVKVFPKNTDLFCVNAFSQKSF